MAADDFSVTLGNGQRIPLGLKIPDKIPLSFAAYPPTQVLSLDSIKKLYAVATRKSAIDLYTKIKNQGRASSCAPYATTTAMEARRTFAKKQPVTYQPEYLYSLVNNGRDEGAMLDDCMKVAIGVNPKTGKKQRGYGCCLEQPKIYQQFNLNALSMEEKNAAAREADDNCSLDWVKMPHGDLESCWAATVSAIAARFPVLMAVHCGNNFFSCGPDGVCRVDQGPGNHAVCGIELVGVGTARSLRDIKILTDNSHGNRFGAKGRYLHTIDHMAGPVQYHQHCACLSMRTSPDDAISQYFLAN
jgi:hypothetical protein